MCNEIVLARGKATLLLHEKLLEALSAEIPQTLFSSVDLHFVVLKYWEVGRRDSEPGI